MENLIKHYLGVDVGMQELIVTQPIQTVAEKFSKLPTQKIVNHIESINAWIDTLSADVQIIFESTGTYSLNLAYCLEIAKFKL